MKQRGAMELINTGLIEAEPAEARGGHAQTDMDAALARTLRRFIAEVSKADQPQAPSEAGQRRAHPLREQGKRSAHLLWGRRDGQG
jgi:hypothetical protein